MFDFVRKHMKVMQFLLFLLIVPSFLVVGVSGYNSMQDKGEVVAKVDGVGITQAEWDAAHKQEVERIRQRMPQIDIKLLDSPSARYATLERMIRDRVVSAAAGNAHLMTTDQRLARELQSNPAIASLRGADGKLDMARYRALVAQRGQTPEMFEAEVRADLSARQLLAGVGNSSFATVAQAAPTVNAFFEKREVQITRFAPADFAERVKPTDADLDAFYKANPSMFQAPEQASVEYVVLDLDTVKKGISVNEADLKSYYEQNIAKNTRAEERRASHILVGVDKAAPAADRAKAKAKAEELLAAVKKNPESFAELAKKNSDDKGSGANGGDLDFFTRGAMVKPFEDAAFSMKKGDIVGPVESDFGFHVIKLTDIKESKQKTYDEMKAELEGDLKKQQAQQQFGAAADSFTNLVYEQADSLKPAADKLKLEIKTATGVARTPAPNATGPLANPKFLAALFSPDSTAKKRNTEAMEIAPGVMVSGRISQYTPARTLPFADVKDKVRDRLIETRAAELAKEEGIKRLAAWKADPAKAQMQPAVVISRQEPGQMLPAVVDAAMRTDPVTLPSWTGVELGAGGYVVVKVTKVLARDTPTPEAAKRERDQYAQWWSSAETVAYFNLLKERLKVQIKVPKPAPTEGPEALN
ncbi:peptidyl-prolyl cis-trans isomerase [Caenimonas koreensis DSM 17982]|uniref:Periplasmic chaperone PpiD n=1 Tax=Caenimonas koreensis DSM 17982 TaxID=1121255 RepID=A0A844B614_9BURK|nr:SurA N-terminal domain-containing protein [Caenimonas koreensis]MRD45981.1 peptidyl-prolyl cis-trans isomerase [Caenimonas koreensis DSM 17982]